MKYFLVQIQLKSDGSVPKSITIYDDKESAMAGYHDTCGQYYKKTDVDQWTVLLFNQYGGQEICEFWEKKAEE